MGLFSVVKDSIKEAFFKNIVFDRAYYSFDRESDYSGYSDIYIDPYSVNGGAKWAGGLSASGVGFIKDHGTIRTNAREAYNDSIHAKLLVDRTADIDVDTGIMLESTPDYEALGISAEEAERWGQNVDSRYHRWCLDQNQNRSRNINFYQSQRLYSKCKSRDGEVFIRLFYSDDNKLQNPLQFEILDANQIRGSAFTTSYYQYGQDDSSDGLVKDDDGVVVGYKVWVRDKTQYKNIVVPAFSSDRNRPMMLHGYEMDYAGQRRGYSALSHALQELENLTDLSLSHIKKAIAQSQINMYVKPSKDKPAVNPLEGVLNGRSAGPLSGMIQTPTQEPVITPPTNPVRRYEMPEATVRNPGTMAVFNLQEGEDLAPFESRAMNDSFESFQNAFFGSIASSMSLPIEVVLMKFGQNYSASRAALILCWRSSLIRVSDMGADYLKPVKDAWLAEEIAAGRIKAPGWSDPRIRDAWCSCQWITAPMPNIDPNQTAKADQLYLELGATTQNRIARNYNGSDAKTNLSINRRMFAETPTSPFNKGGSFASNKEAQGGE